MHCFVRGHEGAAAVSAAVAVATTMRGATFPPHRSATTRYTAATSALFASSAPRLMRFDTPKNLRDINRGDCGTGGSGISAEEEGSPGSDFSATRVVPRTLPASMMPKEVPDHFTPFPLPKYDDSLGFGPVRLSDVPDIEVARAKMQRRRVKEESQSGNYGARRAALMDDMAEADATSFGFLDSLVEDGVSTATATTSFSQGIAANDVVADAELTSANPLGGYSVAEHFPIVDRLECQRTLEDLLDQFSDRPRRLARTATVLDLASTLQKRTDAELTRMFYELGVLFTPDGNGLNFIAARVVKYGRPYAVITELTKAYMHLVQCATEVLVVEQPTRLQRSPDLFVQLLHFLALIKVFQPNKWYTANRSAESNRADYSHPRGANNTTAHQGTGEDLFDYMARLITSTIPEGKEAGRNPLLRECTAEQLVDLLAGFAAVMPEGTPEGAIANPIQHELYQRWSNGLQTEADVQLAERLLLVQRLVNIVDDSLLAALLRDPKPKEMEWSLKQLAPLHLTGAAAEALRGPDFFAAVSRDKRSAVKLRALKQLRDSLDAALDAPRREAAQTEAVEVPSSSLSSAAARGVKANEAYVQALLESGTELLQTLTDKQLVAEFCQTYHVDATVLRAVPHMSEVARRLQHDGACARDNAVSAPLRDVQVALQRQHKDWQQKPPAYVTFNKDGTRIHPVRTLLRDLTYINEVDNVFLLHSSSASGKTLDGLIAAARRLKTGKDALIVSMSCVRALATQGEYSATEQKRSLALRALDIVSYEAEMGRLVLVPTSEELAIHDAGVYCDEDLMLWTLAAFFSRELPLVKVHTLMSRDHPARKPHHTLKGEHSPLASRQDLYSADAPLLSALRSKEVLAVTHHIQLQRPVRDRKSSLLYVNPSRASFLYRRDKAMFDKYHVTARNVAPGFSQGSVGSDTRGLGFYTPDHPQVPFKPLQFYDKHLP